MEPIIVGFDAQSLTGKYPTGLGVYSRNLVRILERHPETIDLRLLWPRNRLPFERTLQRLVWEQYHLVMAATREEVNVIHTPCFSVPRLSRIPKVVTAHDLIVLKQPRLMPPGSRWYFSRWIPGSYRHADHIIAVSRSTKNDLVNLLQINPDKITVIHHGVNPVFTRTTDPHEIGRIRFKYHAPMEFFLMVGSFEARKNIASVIEAFSRISNASPHLKLLLVGKPGPYQRKMAQLVKASGLEEQVLFPGYVPDKELATLYSVAAAFLFISSAEGFGLPLIEAMSIGCPVIATDLEVFHEIGSDAVSYLEAPEPAELSEQMLRMLEDPPYRAEFVRRGFARSLNFSWDLAAEETFRVYLRVLKRH